jgi:hypothetical protein
MTTDDLNEAESSNGTAACAVSRAVPCSALADALALVDFGPCKDAERPQDWINVAGPMCAHCDGTEDVNLAAARIIAAEYRKLHEWIELAAPVMESACCIAIEENVDRLDEIAGCQGIMETCPVEWERLPHLRQNAELRDRSGGGTSPQNQPS